MQTFLLLPFFLWGLKKIEDRKEISREPVELRELFQGALSTHSEDGWLRSRGNAREGDPGSAVEGPVDKGASPLAVHRSPNMVHSRRAEPSVRK